MSEKCVITIEDVLYQAKRKNRNIDTYKIKKAYSYAENKHKNQYRKSGEPYIIHPLHVAYTLAKLGLDTQTICAALLHDVVEDTDACYGDIEKKFGTEIAQIVEGVTKITELFKSVEEKQAENYNKMFGAMEKDIRIIILKLADRLHNINTLEHLKRDRQIAISKETIELYAPIAYKLGMYELKTQLEDGAFKYLYPDDYKNIIIELEEKKKQKQELLEKTKEKIKQELKRQRITAIVKIETKHLYNIYKKINEKKIGMDEIKDLKIKKWLIDVQCMVIDIDEEIQEYVKKIVTENPKMIQFNNNGSNTSSGDAFLIATAISRHLSIITQEIYFQPDLYILRLYNSSDFCDNIEQVSIIYSPININCPISLPLAKKALPDLHLNQGN